jgi:putative phosphonate metabolism protein
MMSDHPARYALYFAPPPESPWWVEGCRWLGYDAASGSGLPLPAIDGVDAAEYRALTAHPRQYGLHATLKAPFRLAADCRPADLVAAVDAYAGLQSAFVLPPLQAVRMMHFIALAPSHNDPRIDAIAGACVTQFDRFRAPLTPAEQQRRLREPLDAVERALLDRWGYPHVLERYRFHLSLTGPLALVSAAAGRAVHGAALALAEKLAPVPLTFDAVCLFEQPSPASSFRLVHRSRFGA